MMYKHAVYTESSANEKLAVLAAEAGAILTGLRYTPRAHFFREDPSGRYAREQRVSGFVDYRSSAKDLDIFVRGGLSAAETAAVIFHECAHISQFLAGQMLKMEHLERESRAHEIECMAPVGFTYEAVVAELAQKMCKWSLKCGDFEAARRFHRQLASVDAAAADELRDALLTPKERRLRIKIEAEKLRRQTESDVIVKEKVAEFKAWSEEQNRRRHGKRSTFL